MVEGKEKSEKGEVLKKIAVEENKAIKFFATVVLTAVAIATAGWTYLLYSIYNTMAENEQKLIKVAQKVSTRYIAISPDGRLIVKANLISPEEIARIVKAFIAQEAVFSESKIWGVTEAYPPYKEFLKKSPLISKWLKYYTEGDAKWQFKNFAKFLYSQGLNNNLPEYLYPTKVELVVFQVNGNKFYVEANVNLSGVYLDMQTGKWERMQARQYVRLRGYIDFSYADPVNNPYGIKITEFFVRLPLKS